MSERDWIGCRSGAILLTSPEPIRNPDAAVEQVSSFLTNYFVIVSGIAVAIGCIFGVARMVRREPVVLFFLSSKE